MSEATKYYLKSRDLLLIRLSFILLLGLSLVSSGFFMRFQRTIVSYTDNLPSVSTNIAFKKDHKPIKINFINQNTDVNVEAMSIDKGIWEISDKSANYLTSSAKPGENGNIVIYGHNTKNIFASMQKVKKGELIDLTSESGTTHTYKVEEIFEVYPDKIDVVAPTNQEVLTVFTCSGLLDSKRLIIKAYPKNISNAAKEVRPLLRLEFAGV